MAKIYRQAMVSIGALSCLLLAGCLGIDSVQIEKKKVTLIHFGLGPCFLIHRIEEKEVDLKKEIEETIFEKPEPGK